VPATPSPRPAPAPKSSSPKKRTPPKPYTKHELLEFGLFDGEFPLEISRGE